MKLKELLKVILENQKVNIYEVIRNDKEEYIYDLHIGSIYDIPLSLLDRHICFIGIFNNSISIRIKN